MSNFEGLRNYATSADLSLSEQQALFARKVQAENAKEGDEQSLMNKIQGVTMPFGVEAIKRGAVGSGGKILKRFGISGGDQLIKDIMDNPNHALHAILQKAKTDAAATGTSIQDQIRERIKNGGVGPNDPASTTGSTTPPGQPDSTTAPPPDSTPAPPPDSTTAPPASTPAQPASTPAQPASTPAQPAQPDSTPSPQTASALEDDDPIQSFSQFVSARDNAKTSPLTQNRATPESSNLSSNLSTEEDPFSTEFSRLPGMSKLADDIAAGRRSMLDGLLSAQVQTGQIGKVPLTSDAESSVSQLAGRKIAPKILDLQKSTNLVPGQALARDSESEVQTMVARATPSQVPSAEASRPPPVNNTNQPVKINQQSTVDEALNNQNVSNNVQNGNANTQNRTDIEDLEDDAEGKPSGSTSGEPPVSSEPPGGSLSPAEQALKDAKSAVPEVDDGIETALKGALVSNIPDLENPFGDIVEAGLGIATLFSSVFGQSVPHPTVVAPTVASPSVGFGIKAQ